MKVSELVKARNNVVKQLQDLRTITAATQKETAAVIDSLVKDVDLLAELAQAQPAVADLLSLTYIKFARAQTTTGGETELEQSLQFPWSLFNSRMAPLI